MFKYFKIMLILSFILGIASSSILAQEHTHKHPEAITAATPQLSSGEVVVTGKIICLGCTLKKERQAKAQCSIYGHTNALLIEKIIDTQGKSIEEEKGKIYQFLHNDQSDKLVKDHSFVGKTFIITGKIYPEANILEVNFFKEKKRGGKVK